MKAIVVEIGTNDDPRFGDTAVECIAAFVLSVPGGCRSTAGPTWPQRLARMVPKVEAALDDVRAIMDQVDPQATWQPILLSYWSPVPRPPIRYSGYFSKIWHGCPIANADMAWGHDTAVPQLNEALRGVAERKGWRFLDLSRSMDGREICATGITHAQEWITGFKYDASSADPLSFDAVRQSLHANAAGHVPTRALPDPVRGAAAAGRAVPARLERRPAGDAAMSERESAPRIGRLKSSVIEVVSTTAGKPGSPGWWCRRPQPQPRTRSTARPPVHNDVPAAQPQPRGRYREAGPARPPHRFALRPEGSAAAASAPNARG